MFSSSIVQTVIAGLILAILTWVGVRAKKIWRHLKRIWNLRASNTKGLTQAQFDELRRMLRPIQPDSNGGKSLPDGIALTHEVIKRLDRIQIRQEKIGDDTAETRGMLENHITAKNPHQ